MTGPMATKSESRGWERRRMWAEGSQSENITYFKALESHDKVVGSNFMAPKDNLRKDNQELELQNYKVNITKNGPGLR